MKKLALSILFMMFLLSGCIKADIGVNVKKDGSVENTVIFAMEKKSYEMLSSFGEDPLEEQKADVLAENYTIEDYDDGEYFGFKASKTFSSIEEYTFLNHETNPLIIESDGNSFKVDGTLDMTMNGEELGLEQQYVDQFELTFTLTLPGKVGQNNADRKEGNKLIWDLSTEEPTEISAESSVSGVSPILLIGGGGIILAAGATYLFSRRKVTPSAGGTQLPPSDPTE